MRTLGPRPARQAEQPRAKRRRRGAAVALRDEPPSIGAEGQGPRKGPAPEARPRGGMAGCGAAPGARRRPPPLLLSHIPGGIKRAPPRAACTTPVSSSDRRRPRPGWGGGGTRLRSAGHPRPGWGQPGSDYRAPGAIAISGASVRVTRCERARHALRGWSVMKATSIAACTRRPPSSTRSTPSPAGSIARTRVKPGGAAARPNA